MNFLKYSQQISMNEKLEALAGRRLQWLNAVEAGDVDTIIYFFSADAEITLFNKSNLKTPRVIRRWIHCVFERFHCEWLLSNVNRRTSDDCAFEWGRFNLSVILKTNGETNRYYGYYKILWRLNENNKWRIESVQFDNRLTIYGECGSSLVSGILCL